MSNYTLCELKLIWLCNNFNHYAMMHSFLFSHMHVYMVCIHACHIWCDQVLLWDFVALWYEFLRSVDLHGITMETPNIVLDHLHDEDLRKRRKINRFILALLVKMCRQKYTWSACGHVDIWLMYPCSFLMHFWPFKVRSLLHSCNITHTHVCSTFSSFTVETKRTCCAWHIDVS